MQWLALYWPRVLIAVLLAVTFIIWWLALRRPRLSNQLFEAGESYVNDTLARLGNSKKTRDKLWGDHSSGMELDPSDFERGMRKALIEADPSRK